MKTDAEILKINKVKGSRHQPRLDQNRIGLRADVSECWVANVIVPKSICRELVPMPWLEPERTEAGYMVSFCANFIRRAKTGSSSTKKEPAYWISEIRIACRDTRTGEAINWVDHQYCDRRLESTWSDLIFPKIVASLEIELGRDLYDHRQLNIRTRDNMFNLHLVEYTDVRRITSKAFGNTNDFQRYFSSSARYYSPSSDPNTSTIIDLNKRGTEWAAMERYFGFLKTAYGNWPVDSVYRSRNGSYEWVYEGNVTCSSD
ncbi:MAG: hypothetical protein AAGH40_09875 [Verrucomicrobiota bacterium]